MAGTAWHIITCEYPPQLGGVSDYTRMVAAGLAAAGESVHVWHPAGSDPRPSDPGVALHDEPGSFSRDDLRRVDAALDRFPGPRRLFVQWVPHGYGYRSMNVGFCLWLLRRARTHGDVVEIMAHEAFLPFRKDRVRENVAALVHRVMTVILLRAASRVWYSIPNWERLWRPYALGKALPFRWLPLPSTIGPAAGSAERRAIREKYARQGLLIGHFGTFGQDIRDLLVSILAAIPADTPDYSILLIGPRGEGAAADLLRLRPDLAGRVHATGALPSTSVGPYIGACDVMLQPYTDGVSTRRTSFMAGLGLGRPMVTTLGFASEPLWKESGAAMFAAPSDTAALATAVASLLRDPASRDRLGRMAAELYQSRFDIEHVITALRQAT
jgi:glycosyltransferase involved in cell wall biosynthesis